MFWFRSERPKPTATKGRRLSAFVLVAGLTLQFIGLPTIANAVSKGSSTGLDLPRFVSLKSERVNMRVGPGRDYRVEWLFTKRGLPMEVIQEFGNWRKVRDSEGAEGWVFQSLLSGDRTALVTPWADAEKDEPVPLTAKPGEQARIIARMAPGVLAEVDTCADGWCHIEVGETEGYAKQIHLWGVYPNEVID